MAESETVRNVKLTPLRRMIRDRMSESAGIPQFSLEIDVETKMIAELRKRLNPAPSVTACLVWFLAQALREKPDMNGYFGGEEISQVSVINIGVAMSIPGGLIVPVIKGADQMSLPDLAMELTTMLEKVKRNRLSPDDVHDGTFTFSNLGMYGIKKFIPLLNPPQLGIIGVGGIRDGLKMVEGKIQSYPYLTVTLSADHRALDGAVAAEFLAIFKKICEADGSKDYS